MDKLIISDEIRPVLERFFDIPEYQSVRVFIIADENTNRHCVPLLEPFVPHGFRKIIIGPGEVNKNLQSCMMVWKALLQSGADRQSLILNVGGGVVTDLGSFVASTYMRGIRFVNIPTSLLGMVDAAVGGKTGVDFDNFKNIIGTFSVPESILILKKFLDTLPDAEWRNGISEMVKHGLIADIELWKKMEELILAGPVIENPEHKKTIESLLQDAVRIKMSIVERDRTEQGERKFLNFGHTVGHALETFSLGHDQDPVSHGRAVAIGIICESFISGHLAGLPDEALQSITTSVAKLFPSYLIPKTGMQEIVHAMRSDKKSEAGSINMVLLKRIGEPVIKNEIPEKVIYDSLHFYNSIAV